MVPVDPARITDDLCRQLRQLLYRQLLTCSDVYRFIPGIMIHQKYARIRQVIHIQKLPERRSRSPAGHFLCTGYLCLMEAAYQRREHMAVGRMIIVVRAVQIRRHRRNVVSAILTV